MILNAALFLFFSVITYTLISFLGQIAGSGTKTLAEAVLAVMKPLPLLVIFVGNVFFAMAVFVGFKITPFAVPAAIALGVIVSFVYSVLFLGGSVTAVKVFGVAVVVFGIFLLR